MLQQAAVVCNYKQRQPACRIGTPGGGVSGLLRKRMPNSICNRHLQPVTRTGARWTGLCGKASCGLQPTTFALKPLGGVELRLTSCVRCSCCLWEFFRHVDFGGSRLWVELLMQRPPASWLHPLF